IFPDSVRPAMQVIAAAPDHGAELAARRMPELGRKLVLQNAEFRYGIIWQIHHRAGYVFAIVVGSLDHEVVVPRTLAAHRWARSCAYSACSGNSGSQQRQIQISA